MISNTLKAIHSGIAKKGCLFVYYIHVCMFWDGLAGSLVVYVYM